MTLYEPFIMFNFEFYQLIDFRKSTQGEDDGNRITQSSMLIQFNKN